MLALSLLTAVVFMSCMGGNKAKNVLDAAAGMLAEHPDSAYLLLTGSDSLFASESEALRMRYTLLTADAANKAFIPLTADSLLRAAAVYYDAHGDANERVRAHYLLGCAYRDMGNAVGALREYYEAVDRADTLSRDCDYKLMSCVFGQMSDVFCYQYLQEDAIKYEKLYSAFALKAKDTLNWLLGKELQIPLYFLLRDTANVLSCSEEVANLYLKYGYLKEASRVYPSAIRIYIGRGDYKKAKVLMDKMEFESDLYDEDGNITNRREYFYYIKGMYCLGVNRIDSAEMYFRMLPRYGCQYESCKGLLSVFRKKNNKDSILKYSSCLEGALEHTLSKVVTKEVAEVAAKYELRNNLLTQHQKSAEGGRRSVNGYWIIFPVVVLCAIVILLIVRMRSGHINKNVSLNEAVLSIPCDLRNDEIGMQSCAIIGKLNSFASYRVLDSLSPGDWEQLNSDLQTFLPAFYDFINKSGLSFQERRLCILTRLGFTPGSIAVLMGTTSQRITNIKRSSNEKLFNEHNAKSLENNLKKK